VIKIFKIIFKKRKPFKKTFVEHIHKPTCNKVTKIINMIKSTYPGSQPTLYQVCMLIALNCKSKIADFALFSAAYTLVLVDAIIAAIDQAEQLPGEEARAAEHELIRQGLIPINKESLRLWQYLKRYIAKLYPDSPDSQKTAWAAAGWNHYDNNNAFVETKALMNMGSQYIAQHKSDLLSNDNMPATFETQFNDQAALFNTTYTKFVLAEEAAVEGTDAKIEGNNGIYKQIIGVCLDGQAIFEGNDTLKGQFSFEKVSQLVSPQGASAVKFHVINTATGLPMAGVAISLNGSDKMVTTNDEGDAEMTQLSSGDATFTLTADGFTEKMITVTLTGTKKSADVSMEPMFAGEMNVGSDVPSTPTAAVN
jgi:hypothetical protein